MILLAALALVIPQDADADARALAGSWLSSPPSAESLRAEWDSADSATRTRMAMAAWHHKGDAALVVLEEAMDDPVMARRPRWRQAYLDVAIWNGILPGQESLEPLGDAALTRYRSLLDEGWLPAGEQAAKICADPILRGPTLRAWAAQPTRYPLPGAVDTSTWPPFERMLHEVLEARGAETVPAADAARWLREVVQPGYTSADRQLAVARLTDIAPRLPAATLDEVWPNLPDSSRAMLLPILENAPAALAWLPLRSLALARGTSIEDRAAAVRRLFALDGARAANEMLALLDASAPEATLQAALFGLRDWGESNACSVLEPLLSSLPEPSRGLALEVLALHGDARQARLWQERFEALSSRERRGVLRAALTAGQEGVLEWAWSIVNGPPSEIRVDAETVVREFQKEPELVAGFRRGLNDMDTADARVEQLTRIARLRDPAAAAAMRVELFDPRVAAHPLAYTLAARLLEDTEADVLLRTWWDGSVPVNFQARYTAAIRLAYSDEDCAAFVRDKFFEADQGLLLGVVSMIRANPTAANLAAARAWMSDARVPEMVRRELAASLPMGIEDSPASRWMTYAGMRDLEQVARAGMPIDVVFLALTLSSYRYGDASLLDDVDRLIRRLRFYGTPGAEALDARLEEQRAFLGRPGYGSEESLERVLAGLRNPAPARRHDAEPAIPPLAQEYAAFDSALRLLLARPAEEILPPLESALAADLGVWHPDLLWLAARRAERSMPSATALFDETLRRLEPPRSRRVPATAPPPPPLPALESDTQAFFSRIEKTVLDGDLETADAWLKTGKIRHPGDRRLWQWQGWVDIARGRLDEAEQAFRHADRLGGMTPYLHLEQTLGLAVVAELRDPASLDLESFLDYENQAGRLLSMRLPIAARPDLEVLLPAAAQDD